MRLFSKIFLYSLVLSLLPIVVVSLLSRRDIGAEVEQRTYQNLEERVMLLVPVAGAALERNEDVQQRVRRLDARTRYTVMADDGRVLADSWKDPGAMENHADRPEFLASRTELFGHATRRSATLDRDMLYVATRIELEGRTLGFARAAVAREDVTARSDALRGWLFLALLISVLGGTLLAFVIARRRSRTIQRMSAAAHDIAEGDTQRRVSDLPSDELGDLGRSFNVMAEQLDSRLYAITRERRRLATVLAGMVEGVIAVDGEMRVVHCNEAARHILDIPRDPKQRPVQEVIPLPDVATALEKAAASGSPVDLKAAVDRDGGARSLHFHASPLREPGAPEDDATFNGAVLVVHDVTELRRLEQVRRDFVANASHELKTPVASIRGMVETILDDEEMPEDDRARFLNRVLTQAGRLQNLIEEMLALSRLEAAEGFGPIEEIDIRGPAREAFDAVLPLAREKQIELAHRLASGPVRARAHREAIRRIVSNLLDNAVKYTPAGGRVDLDVGSDGDWAILRVADTGIGIPSGKEHRVFERFYRIDEGRARAAGGTGLGLAIVKHLAISLGGDVVLESAEGLGSTFLVRLPRARP